MLHKILLDTDIGDDIDDAIALALGVKSSDVDFKGVITTYRNSRLRAKIALSLLDELNRLDIPVAQGLADPLKQSYFWFPFDKKDINGKPIIGHYEDYMDTFEVSKKSGIDLMAETIRQNPNEISLVCIGPLTDIATLYKAYPKEYGMLKEIVIMGGRFDENRAEWNIKCDPEAADIVFSSGQKIRLVPLDVTLQCVFSEEQIHRLGDCNSKNVRLTKMINIWRSNTKNNKLPILHDPLALSVVFSDFCNFEPMNIRIGLDGGERGCTIIDNEKGYRIFVALKVKSSEFTEYVCNSLCD